jgi:hypothetical protein
MAAANMIAATLRIYSKEQCRGTLTAKGKTSRNTHKKEAVGEYR